MASSERGWKELSRTIVSVANWRAAISFGALGILIYLVLDHISQLSSSITTALTSNGLWLLVSLAAIAITFFTAAGAYWAICRGRIKYFGMLKVQVASAFASRLLPANIGGLALNIRYINHHLHSRAQSVTLVAFNNVLGFITYMFTLLVLLIILGKPISSLLKFHVPIWLGWVIPLGFMGFMLIIVSVKYLRLKFSNWFRELTQVVTSFRDQPLYIVATCTAYVLTTLAYVFSFYACARSLGASLSFTQAFVAFTLGLTVGSVAPTPGGLLGVELGLYSGLYAAGVPAHLALSSVLVYRLLAYWLPIVPGLVTFRHILKQKIV